MKRLQLEFQAGFDVVAANRHAQAAVMALRPGESTGGPDNRHAGSDQWLYVVAGDGAAVVEGRRHELRTGTLLLVERGEAHEIRNTGERRLETLNLYVPPAYPPYG